LNNGDVLIGTLIAVGTDGLHMAHSAKATLQAIKAG